MYLSRCDDIDNDDDGDDDHEGDGGQDNVNSQPSDRPGNQFFLFLFMAIQFCMLCLATEASESHCV